MKAPDLADVDGLCEGAGACIRRALVAEGVAAWPQGQDVNAGRALTGDAYCEIAEALEATYFARQEDDLVLEDPE